VTREQVLVALPVAAAIAAPLLVLALAKLADWMDRRPR
jgi:hypothetical protein